MPLHLYGDTKVWSKQKWVELLIEEDVQKPIYRITSDIRVSFLQVDFTKYFSVLVFVDLELVLQCAHSNRDAWKKIVQSQRFQKNRDSQVFCFFFFAKAYQQNSRFSFATVGNLKTV